MNFKETTRLQAKKNLLTGSKEVLKLKHALAGYAV